MEASEEHYLLALVNAMNLSHFVDTNSTAADLADILEQVATENSMFFLTLFQSAPSAVSNVRGGGDTLRCLYVTYNIQQKLQRMKTSEL